MRIQERSYLRLYVLVAIALIMIYPQLAKAQAQVIKQTFNEPFDEVFHANDPFVGGCLIEDVHVFGTIPTQTQITTDAKGGLHVKFQQIAKLSAVGLSTGDTYRNRARLSLLNMTLPTHRRAMSSFTTSSSLLGLGGMAISTSMSCSMLFSVPVVCRR